MKIDSVKTEDGYPLDSRLKHYCISPTKTVTMVEPNADFGSGRVWFGGSFQVPDENTGRIKGLFRTQAAAWAEVAQQYIDQAKEAMKTSALCASQGV